MKIITISREFGSGGRELGKRLADLLGYDYYDREIITAISQNQGLDEKYVENSLNNQGWRGIPLTYRRSFSCPQTINSTQINLLLAQKKVIEDIAELGKNCVIVGRNADVILEKYNPFNVFVCADMQTKIRRCEERAEGEKPTRKQIEKYIRRIDKNRKKNRELISNTVWGDSRAYHLTINTTDWEIKKLAAALNNFILQFWENNK